LRLVPARRRSGDLYWPDATNGKLFLNGRQVFDFEKVQLPQLDARTLEVR
jgi:hypothetical protein